MTDASERTPIYNDQTFPLQDTNSDFVDGHLQTSKLLSYNDFAKLNRLVTLMGWSLLFQGLCILAIGAMLLWG